MRLNKKVSSFTLSEMIVVLVISTIVISLAITTINLVQQQIMIIHRNFEKNTEIRLLERALLFDFNKHHIEYNKLDEKLVCTSINDTIVYSFKPNYILRNNDTLNISISENTVYLDGKKVIDKNIDAISLYLSKGFLNRRIFVSKQKDAAHYMNN